MKKKDEIEDMEDSHSELDTTSTEESNTRMIKVFIEKDLFLQFEEIQKWYRSPSITHTIKLMIEDIYKGLQTSLYPQMVKILHEGQIPKEGKA